MTCQERHTPTDTLERDTVPLPTENQTWPPAGVHTSELREYDAWYSSDPDKLSGLYGGGYAGATPAQMTHRTTHAGGIAGRVARWFWGTPTADGEQRTKLHVPLAADICGTSADLLFSEPVQLTGENEKVAAFLQGLQEDGLDAKLHEGAEVGAALGGTFLKTVWDTDVQARPWTEVAHPDGAVPEWRNGRMTAVTLWTQLPDKGGSSVWRLMERHESGSIEYALFEGTVSNVGKRKPLPDHPDTEWLAVLVDGDSRQATNVKALTCAYVPNMLPNRLHRTSPMGRSDLQGVTPWLDALDEAYSSWWRDIRLAKARIHMPETMLDSNGAGMGATADYDRELYVPVSGVLSSAGSALSDSIHVQQFAIRVTEHAETCQNWTDQIVRSAGYSTQSLSGDSGGAMTATEVRAHQQRSYATRGKKIRYWTQGLRAHLQAQLEVGSKIGAGVTPGDFSIEFADGVQESAMELAQTGSALRTAQAASTHTLVKMIHPDWDQNEVDEEVERINRESGVGEPVPVPDDAGL